MIPAAFLITVLRRSFFINPFAKRLNPAGGAVCDNTIKFTHDEQRFRVSNEVMLKKVLIEENLCLVYPSYVLCRLLFVHFDILV